jgi:hypothetical protein
MLPSEEWRGTGSGLGVALKEESSFSIIFPCIQCNQQIFDPFTKY